MKNSRRKFLKALGGSSALLAAGLTGYQTQARVVHIPMPERTVRHYSPNDNIRIATIGMGIIGHYDTEAALKVSGTELVAVCDLYAGRLEQAKNLYGKKLITTRDYREILARKDVDAVLICTPDHWHHKMVIDALGMGKHVYCEKPMIHKMHEGAEIIAAQEKSGKVLQVGSQRTSSIMMAEARKLYETGAIGKINAVMGTYNRHGSLGAWQYSIPPDASPKTLDYDRFLGNASKVGFDATRFFRWRNYRDYGTGVPGDLFVHLLSGLHYITGSLGPSRIMATGELSYWKDGRDVPDVVNAIMRYDENEQHPAFQAVLQANLADGSGGGSVTRIIGTDGVIELGWNDFVLKRLALPKAPQYGGYDSLFTFPKSTQQAFIKKYNATYSEADQKAPKYEDIVFKAPDGYDDRIDHFQHFFDAIRNDTGVLQDAAFGFRAAAPCLATNISMFEGRIVKWNPKTMKMT
jgi:predicted dehydrogenase